MKFHPQMLQEQFDLSAGFWWVVEGILAAPSAAPGVDPSSIGADLDALARVGVSLNEAHPPLQPKAELLAAPGWHSPATHSFACC